MTAVYKTFSEVRRAATTRNLDGPYLCYPEDNGKSHGPTNHCKRIKSRDVSHIAQRLDEVKASRYRYKESDGVSERLICSIMAPSHAYISLALHDLQR